MTARRWLPGYRGQSTDTLVALAASHRVDSIILAYEEAIRQKQSRLGHSSLSNEEWTILAVDALEREVNNGGYRLFFANSSCEYAKTIVAALNVIGQQDVAHLNLAAIQSLGLGSNPTPQEIATSLTVENGERDQILADLTGSYLDIAGDLAEPLFKYVKLKRDKIVL